MASRSTPATQSGGQNEYSLQQPSSVAFSVDHPRLTNTNPKAIRVFLSRYDQYSKEVTARALQLSVVNSTTTEPARPVSMTYCVDSEWLQSYIDLEYIPDVETPHDLTDTKLRLYLESEAEEEKHTTTMTEIDAIIKRELVMNMSNSSSRSRMKSLFTSYVLSLRRNGLIWVMNDHPKLAVKHIVSAVRPKPLQLRLETDLELVHAPLKKDFKGFMKHAMSVAEAFQIVDTGPPSSTRTSKPYHRGNRTHYDSGSGSIVKASLSAEPHRTTQKGKRSPPPVHILLAKKKARDTGLTIAKRLLTPRSKF